MSEITPEVAAALAIDGGGFYDAKLNGWVTFKAEGDTVQVKVSDHDDDGKEIAENAKHFRAVVVEGEQTPIVLPAGAALDYINGDSGYHWLTCGTCETSLMEVTAGTSFGEMAAKIAAHKCAEASQAVQNGGTP